MSILHAIVLGIVQGLTEFLPISSSGHLIVVPYLFGWDSPLITSLAFSVVLHGGTLLALLVYFRADWVRLKALERFPHSPQVFREARARLVRRSAAAQSGPTLKAVKDRGTLVCGVSEGLPGFSAKDDKGAWNVSRN